MPAPSSQARTIGQQLSLAKARLERAGVPGAGLDAELLMADLLRTNRGGLRVRRADPLERVLALEFDDRLARREAREPLQHIIGQQEFWGLPFRVDGRVLVPRPETEGLVDAALALDLPRRARIADLGTGSGCLAVTLGVQRRDLRLYAQDRSADALAVALCNAQRHGVEDRIDFREGDFGCPPDEWLGEMDVVLSNPPYVSAAEWNGLQPEVREHDPREALVAGPSGLEAYAALFPSAHALLRPDGFVIAEIGYGQGDAVLELARGAGFCAAQLRPDLRGIPRVLIAERATGKEVRR